jgi:hypothetical protein
MGLRLADFEYRPLPLSTRFVARRMGWLKADGKPDDSRGWKALRALVARGVLVPAEPLEGRGDWPGTRTFLPPEPLAAALGFGAASDDTVEREAGVVEAAVPEPGVEIPEQPGVDGTGSADGQDDGMVTVRLDAAIGGAAVGEHVANGTPAVGGARCAVFTDD